MRHDHELENIIYRISESTTISQLERILERIIETFRALSFNYTLVDSFDLSQAVRNRLHLDAGAALHELLDEPPYELSSARRDPSYKPPFLPQVHRLGEIDLVHLSVSTFLGECGDIKMAWGQDIARSSRELQRDIRDLVTISLHLHDATLCILGGATAPRDRYLPKREAECLYLASMGFQGRETAKELHISEAAVRLYLTNARRHLAARNTTQAVARALVRGLMRRPTLTGLRDRKY